MSISPADLRARLAADPQFAGGGGFAPTATIAALLTRAQTQANPVPAAQVPAPLTVQGLLAALTDAGRAYVVGLAQSDLEPVAARIREQDRAGVLQWATVAHLAGKFSADDVEAVEGVLNATVPDPAWQATVPAPALVVQWYGVGGLPLSLIDAALGRTS